MPYDHHYPTGQYREGNVLRELTAAIERRGLQDATCSELFVLQRDQPEKGGWQPELVERHHHDMPEKFAKAVEGRPGEGWRVVVLHVLSVTTMLYEHSPEVRG